MSIRSPRIALILLLLVSLVWGAEFVLIDLAIERLPTHTFNALRFAVAALALLPLLWLSKEPIQPGQFWRLLGAGLLLGFLLFIGFYTQTEGLLYTSVSNAGFITGLNVPLVPLLGFLLLGSRAAKSVWIGVGTATAGLYLLTVGDKLSFNHGDTLVLICAFAFASHILLTGRVAATLPVLPLSLIQLLAVALYSTLAQGLSPDPAFHLPGAEPLSWQQQLSHPLLISAVLVAGVLGSGFAYWAQTGCQRILAPHKVALVFATEPLFAHATAWLFLGETLGPLGIAGACLILGGMLVAELGDRPRELRVQPLDQSVAAE